MTTNSDSFGNDDLIYNDVYDAKNEEDIKDYASSKDIRKRSDRNVKQLLVKYKNQELKDINEAR